MDPTCQSIPEAGAYDLLRELLADLRKAERVLAIVEAAEPDPERETHLAAIRAALAQLHLIFPSPK